MKSSTDWNKLYKEQGKEQSSRGFNSNMLYLFRQKKKSILNTISTNKVLLAPRFKGRISSSSALPF